MVPFYVGDILSPLFIKWSPVRTVQLFIWAVHSRKSQHGMDLASCTAACSQMFHVPKQLEPILRRRKAMEPMEPTGALGVDCFFEGWLTSKWHVPMLSSLILLFGNSNQRDIGADKTSRHQMFNSPDYESKFSKFPYLTQISHTILPREENKHTKHTTPICTQLPPSPSSTPQQLGCNDLHVGARGVSKRPRPSRDPSSMGGGWTPCRLNLYSPTTGPTTHRLPETYSKKLACEKWANSFLPPF